MRAGGAGARNGLGAFLSLRFHALESLTLRRPLCAQGLRLPDPRGLQRTARAAGGPQGHLTPPQRGPAGPRARADTCRMHVSHVAHVTHKGVAHTCRTHVSASAGSRVAAAGTRGADSLSPPGNALSRPWATVGGAALPAHAQGQPRAAPDGRQGRRAEPPALGFTLHTSHFTLHDDEHSIVPSARTHKHTNTQTHKHTNTQTHTKHPLHAAVVLTNRRLPGARS